jgi:GTPase SAR1 family protein
MTQENKLNSHIVAYLDYYCGLSHAPGFAVLLKGQWGAGKTWFIKNYCKKLKEKNQKYLYVSLYGMTNFSEIEYAFFQQLHPVLSSKGMAITGKIFKGLLKGALKIDLDSDSKDEGTWNVQIPEINLPEYLQNTDKSILIFDDLERCQIEISNILGYINYFVERQELKVVIVANEHELLKNNKNELLKDSKYKAFKEKLIGKTFGISLDFEGALEDFISVTDNLDVRKFLSENTHLIQDLYKRAESENLRILKQIVLDFERIFNELPEKAKNKLELLQDLLQLLMAFSIEIKRGTMLPTDMSKLEGEFDSVLRKTKNMFFGRYPNDINLMILMKNCLKNWTGLSLFGVCC